MYLFFLIWVLQILAPLITGFSILPSKFIRPSKQQSHTTTRIASSTNLQTNVEKTKLINEASTNESVDALMTKAIRNLNDRFLEIDLRTKRHMKMILDLYRVSSLKSLFKSISI